MAFTKNDIVEQIQKQLSFPKNQSQEITETLLELMKSNMESGSVETPSMKPEHTPEDWSLPALDHLGIGCFS
jgi:hypothetical protein